MPQLSDRFSDEELPELPGQFTEEELSALAAAMQEQEEQQEARRRAVLESLATTVIAMRDEAVTARQASGIEQIWLEDQEMYEGIDDANRAEEGTNRTRKPISDAGGGSGLKSKPSKSTVFLNIARPYADAAAARISDMLLPVDDRPWEFDATPVAEIIGLPSPQIAAASALAVTSPELVQYSKQQDDIQQIAKRRAKNAQKKVEDWLTECDWHGEVRKVIDQSARIGTGVLKGPYPKLKKVPEWRQAPGNLRVLRYTQRVDPESRAISAWNLFPDPACGEDIHNGAYVFEREQYWTRKMLGEYRTPEAQKAGWIAEQIEEVLKEGPRYRVDNNTFYSEGDRDDYEVWHGYCTLESKDLRELGVDIPEDVEAFVPVYVLLCNDRIIKVVQSPVESGDFPYDVFPWSPREGMPWGKGVVRQVRTPQRIVNAGTRNMMDNAGSSSGVMMFMNRSGIDTNGGNGWLLNGNRVFYTDDGVDLARALRVVEVPTRQGELLNIIQFAMKMAEDVTGLPMLMQGQQGAAPDTVGGMNILNNNANGVLRRMARQFDAYITEPHIRRYNEWLQSYSDDPEVQGDFHVDARGSSALVERDIQNQAIAQMLPFVQDPEFRINKEKWFAEWSKSQRLDPKRFQYTEEEWKQMQQQMQPPPPPPQVMAAQIRADSAMQQTQIAQQGETERLVAELQAKQAQDAARLQAEMQQSAMEWAARREMAVIQLLGEENLTKEEIKARLLEMVTKDRRERDIFMGQKLVKAQYGTSVDMPG